MIRGAPIADISRSRAARILEFSEIRRDLENSSSSTSRDLDGTTSRDLGENKTSPHSNRV